MAVTSKISVSVLIPTVNQRFDPFVGLLLMHDFTYPPKAYLVWIWRSYFKTLHLVGSHLFPAWREIYYGLSDLIQETRWVPELKETLRENGFKDIHMEYLTAYGSAIVTAGK